MTPLELLHTAVTRFAPNGITPILVLRDIHQYGPERLKNDGYIVQWSSEVVTKNGSAIINQYGGHDVEFSILTMRNANGTVHHCIPGSASSDEVRQESMEHFIASAGPYKEPLAAMIGEAIARFMQRTFA